MAQLWSFSVKANTTDSGPGGDDQIQPSIVRLGDGFLTVWTDTSGDSGSVLRAQKFGFLGQKLGSEFTVSDNANSSSSDASLSATPDGGFVMAYRNGSSGIDLAWFNANGTKTNEITVSPNDGSLGRNPSVAGLSNGNVLVTWDQVFNGDRAMLTSLYSASGGLLDSWVDFDIEDLQRNGDTAAWGNGQSVSLYMRDDLDELSPGVDGTRYIGFRVYDADGAMTLSRRIGSDDLAELDADSAHITRVPGIGFAMAWSMKGEFTGMSARVRLYDTFGNKLNPGLDGKAWGTIGEDAKVEDIIGYSQSDGTGSAFTMIYRNAETDELFGQDFDGAGNTTGDDYRIAGNVQDASLAMTADGRIAVSITRTTGGNADIRTFLLDPREVVIVGTEGSDVLTSRPVGGAVIEGRGGDDLLYGDDSGDVLKGGDEDDLLLGNAGNDSLYGGRGEDSLSGGSGTDTANFSDLDRNEGKPNGASTLFNVSLEDGLAVLAHRLGDDHIKIIDQLNSIENVIGSAGDDTIYGNEANNSLTGGNGNDTLWGGIGGSDTLIGGNGSDRYIVDDVGDTVIENGTGADKVYLDDIIVYSLVSRPNIEALYYSVSIAGEAVHLTGNGLANLIAVGKAFRATESNTSGNDILDGGGGNDILMGGLGDDTYRVDTSLDFVDEKGDPLEEGEDVGGIDTVESKATAFSLDVRTAGRIENLIYTGSGNFFGGGNQFANELTGGNGNDLLKGRGGADTLKGLGGNDRLEGEGGADTIDGGGGLDIVSYEGFDADIVLSLDGSLTASNQAAADTLISIEGIRGSGTGNDQLTGDNAANVLEGDGGNDILRGRGGTDRIVGGEGSDTLTGGGGLDTFAYKDLDEGGDSITDFDGASDSLAFDLADVGPGLAQNGTDTGSLNAIRFQASSSASAASTTIRFIYDTDDGRLFFDFDGSGAGPAILIATLQGAPSLTTADIFIV